MKGDAEKTPKMGYGTNTNRPKDAKDQTDYQKDYQWDNFKGKSKEDAQNEYIKLAKDILQRNKAEKYIKDF